MTTTDKLHSLAFAATCIKDVVDTTKPQCHDRLNRLARIFVAITEEMDTLKREADLYTLGIYRGFK